MTLATAYVLRVYMVLSEDPWRAKPVREERYREWEEAREAFTERLGELEASGYKCSDYASAWSQLCLKPVAVERVEVDGVEPPAPVYEKLLLALEPG